MRFCWLRFMKLLLSGCVRSGGVSPQTTSCVVHSARRQWSRQNQESRSHQRTQCVDFGTAELNSEKTTSDKNQTRSRDLRVFIKTRGMSGRVRIVLPHAILTKGPTHAREAVYHPDRGVKDPLCRRRAVADCFERPRS